MEMDLFFVPAQSEIELIVLCRNAKLLVDIVLEGADVHEPSLRVHCQAPGGVSSRHYLVERFLLGLELRSHISLLFLVLSHLGLLNCHQQPDLVAVLMYVVLDHWLTFLSFTSSNIQSFPVGVSLDEVAFLGIGSLVSSHDVEPATVMLARVHHHLSTVVLAISKHAESILVLSHYQGIFSVLSGNGKPLERSSLVGGHG